MFDKITLIGRLGQHAEAKTAQNNREYVVLNLATQESWKNDQGDYETRTEWHQVYAWGTCQSSPRTLQKGQLITLEGTLRYREVTEDVERQLQEPDRRDPCHQHERLSKIEAPDDPGDGDAEE